MSQLKKISSRRWVIVVTIFLAVICNYLDRQLLSILKPEILDHFSIGNFEYALIVNVFLVAYAVMYPLSGIFVDKFGAKPVMFAGITVWSIACIGGGSCGPDQVGLFAACRGLLGMAEPTIFSGQMVAITMWFERKERSTPNALCQAGGSLGAVIAPVVIATLMNYLDSWQHVFYLAGIVGICLGIVWIFVYKTPSKKVLDITLEADKKGKKDNEKYFSLAGLFKTKSLWGGFLIRLVSDPVWYFCCFWLPGFLRTLGENEGLSYSETLDLIQWTGGIPYLAGAIGAFLLSFLLDRLIRRGLEPNKTKKKIMCFTAFGAPLCAIVPFAANSSLPFDMRLAIVIGVFCIIAIVCITWLFNALLLVTEQFPIKNVASVLGICCGAGALGSVVFNQFVGAIPESAWTILFCVMGCLHLIAAVILWKMVGPENPE